MEQAGPRLAAILALDVVGYSRLMGQDEQGTLDRLLNRRHTIIDPQVVAHHGRVVKGTGDGMLAEFAGVQSAIRAGIAIQAALAELNRAEPDAPPMLARIGINLGDVIIEDDGDIYGDGVNIAARLEGHAPAGGICVAGRALDELRRVGVPFTNGGELRLKNIVIPVQSYVIQPDAITRPAPPAVTRAATARRLNVRMMLAAFAVLFVSLAAWMAWQRVSASSQTIVLVEPLHAAPSDAGAQLLGQSLATDLARMVVQDATVQVADAGDAGFKARLSAYRLTGVARTDGADLHASVRLTRHGGDTILWSADFTRTSAEADALREEVAARVADVITCALNAKPARDGTLPLASLRVFLAGCEVRHRDWPAAAAFFRQVTEMSPRFAEGWSYYAVSLAQQANDQPPAEAATLHRQAESAAQHALALDPHATEAYFALAVSQPTLREWDAHDAAINRGLSLDPDNPELVTARFFGLAAMGRVHDAAPVARRAVELSPFAPVYAVNLAEQLGYSGNLTEARKVLEGARARWGHELFTETARFEMEARIGDPAVAEAMLADRASALLYQPDEVAGWRALIAVRAGRSTPASAAGSIAATAAGGSAEASLLSIQHLVQLGNLDQAFALAARLPSMTIPLQSVWYRGYMTTFRRDPRFMDIAARQGLARIWLSSGRWPDFCAEDHQLGYACRVEAQRAVRSGIRRSRARYRAGA